MNGGVAPDPPTERLLVMTHRLSARRGSICSCIPVAVVVVVGGAVVVVGTSDTHISEQTFKNIFAEYKAYNSLYCT